MAPANDEVRPPRGNTVGFASEGPLLQLSLSSFAYDFDNFICGQADINTFNVEGRLGPGYWLNRKNSTVFPLDENLPL